MKNKDSENYTADSDTREPVELDGSRIWPEFYDAVDRIRGLEPWEKFCEIDVAEIHLPYDDESYYVSVSGFIDDINAVAVYRGESGLISLSTTLTSGVNELPEYVLLSKKNCLEVTWGERGDLKKQDYERIRAAGKKYRGRDAWPLARKYETGFEPWEPDETDTGIFTNILNHFCEAYEALEADGSLDKIKEGERIGRHYDTIRQIWINEIVGPINEIEAHTEGCVITDELLIRRLKKKPQSSAILEMDMPYATMMPVGKRGERAFYPRLCLICDADTTRLEEKYFVNKFEDTRDVVLGMLVNYINNTGHRPAEIYVRDPEIFGIIAQLCHEVEIDLFFTSNLSTLDEFVYGIMDYLEQGPDDEE